MARWISHSLSVFLGFLALAATVGYAAESSGADSEIDLQRAQRLTAQDSTEKNEQGTSTKRKRKQKKSKKKRIKYNENRPATSSASTQRTPYKGTGGLGPDTWKAAFRSGTVFNGRQYMDSVRYRHSPDEMPTVCENWNMTVPDLPENTTRPVLFYCPADSDAHSLDHCCGPPRHQHCCAYESNPHLDPNAVLIVSILSALVAVAVVIFGCCVWKKIHQKSELDKQPADQVVVANMADPMLPPTIVTSPPPQSPSQELEQAVVENGVIDEVKGTAEPIKETDVDGMIPDGSSQNDTAFPCPGISATDPAPDPV